MSFFNHYRGLKKELYVYFFVRLIVAMGSFVSSMFVLLMSTKLHYDETSIALIMSLTTLLYIPAGVIGGRLADRYSRKKIILITEFTIVALYWIAAILPISDLTVILIFLSYFLNSISGPASSTFITDFSTSSQRDKAFSIGYLGFNLGYILAPLIGGVLFTEHFNWSLFFNGAAILISSLLILFFMHEKNSYRDHTPLEVNEYESNDNQKTLMQMLGERKVLLAIIFASYLTGLVYNVVGFIAPLQLSALFGEEAGAIWYGSLISFNALGVIILTPITIYFYRHMKPLMKMIFALLLLIISMAVFAFSGWLPLFFLAMFFYTSGEVFNTLGYMPYVTQRIPASHRGRVFGTISILATLLASLSSLFVGYLVDVFGYQVAWTAYIGIGMIGLIIYVVSAPLDRTRFPNIK